MTRGFVPLLALVAAAGLAALDWGTEGFRVVTSDGARRLAVASDPRALPDFRLVDQDGAAFSLADYRGRTVLVDFIYTGCPTICGLRGADFGDVAARPGAPDLLSISFDPADDGAALKLYGARYGAAAPRWRIAAPADRGELARLLRSFGAVVAADRRGGFVHDSAVYLVDPRGRLARIIDPETPPGLAAASRLAAR